MKYWNKLGGAEMKAAINRRKVFSILLSVLMVAGTLSVPLYADETATSMKLTSTEGSVTISNGLGKKIKTFAGMNLNNGYHIVTEAKSLARLNLDDAKLATVDEYSDVDIAKKGSDLELHLHAGDVLVAVNQKMSSQQSFKIRSANVVMGITGTIPSARFINGGLEVSFFESGGRGAIRDAVTGAIKYFSVKAGEKVIAKSSGGLNVAVGKVGQKDVTPAVADYAKADPNAAERMRAGTGNAIDVTDSSQYQNPIAANGVDARSVAGNAETVSIGGSAVNPVFFKSEEEVKRAETKAAEEAEKARHHHRQDDDDVACDHGDWGEHVLPEIVRTGYGTDLSYNHSGRSITISVTCGRCHRSVNHVIEISPHGELYTEEYGMDFSWHCTTCGQSGEGSCAE